MLRNRGLRLFVIVLSLAAVSLGQAWAAEKQPGMSYINVKETIPVSQLNRGMRGHGLTVFQGTKIDKFDFVILGVLKQANTGKDFILARIGGGPITTRGLGVAHGMSGSPCYVDGKLVGALSAAMQWSKEPIGMITPIADMMEALDENLPKRASGYSSITNLNQPAMVEGKAYNKIVIDGPDAQPSDAEDGALHIRPLAMPVMVSGLSNRGMGSLEEIFKPFNVKPMAGPGGAGKKDVPVELVPGAAVGMSVATGDIDISAVGTLTYRKGNKLVAWGHPFLGIGAIDAPMTTCYVVDVLTGYNSSTKLAFPMKTVGRVFQDRPWSIAGTVGEVPKMIPVKVTVDDQAIKRGRTFNVNVINHPLLASRLVTMVIGEAIYQVHTTPGDATAEVSYEINADQIGKIRRSNVFFDPAAIDAASVSDVGALLQLLSSNKFYPVDIKSVDIKVKIADRRNTATVDRVFVKKSEYEPGETVDVGVVLRPYKSDRITRTFSIKIPATAPDGKVTLQVRGGGSPAAMAGPIPQAAMMEDDGGSLMMALGGTAGADNVKQLVDKYLEREKNNEIVVQLQMKSTAINIAGEKLTGLPSSIADVMKSSRNSGLSLERDEVKETFAEDYIVFGASRLTINIKQKSLNESKAPSRPGVPTQTDGVDSPMSNGSDDGGATSAAFLDDSLDFESVSTEPSVSVTEETVEDTVEDEEIEAPAEPVEEKPAQKPTEAKPEEKKTSSPAAKVGVKPVTRQPKTWSQRSQADFAKGTFSGVAANSLNNLELTPTLKKLVETPEQFVWSVAPAKDGVYAGTGNGGKIYHISESGDIKPFYETGELEVHALVRDSRGNIYAGTSPNGKVFKISPEGNGELILDAEERYVVALSVDGEDNIYAGVGDAGKIYRIAADGTQSVFAEINEQQILSLSWEAEGSLLVGTGINGVVYKIAKNGSATPIFDAAESSISSVAGDSEGNVYAGTSPKGVIYKITPDGRSKQVFSRPTSRVLSMSVDPNGYVYAVSDGTLIRISPDETVLHLDSANNKAQYLSIVYNVLTDTLYAGTGNIGEVHVSKCCDVSGTFESPVHDTKMISRWGRIKWTAEVPEGTGVELQTRSGNVEKPDTTWSTWSRTYTNASGEQVQDRDARYIQYRVTLRTGKSEISPKVSGVTISYLTPNQAPTVKLTAPAGGATWSGSQTIRWTGSDPDKDTLTYDVFYSTDGGKEWTALVGDMGSDGSSTEKKLTTGEIVDKVKTEVEKSPDIPDDMKKQALKGQASTDSSSSNSNGLPKPGSKPSAVSTSYSWDTTKAADGTYLVKVVASDKSSNATGALTEKVISEPFVVCNTAPKLMLLAGHAIEVTRGDKARFGGAVESKIEIAGVQYRVDGGQWMSAAADDGVFDSPSESFSVTLDALPAGSHKLEVQAIDAAGNASSKTLEVKVS